MPVTSASVPPLVSFLLPTRARSGLVRRSLASLVMTAADAASIEIMLGTDLDDTEEGDAAELACREFGLRYQRLRFPPLGYAQLHRYNNALARAARGAWLMLWNDDVLMQTWHWDESFRDVGDRFWLLDAAVSNANQARFRHGLFPAVPATWPAVTGWLSRSPQCDTYLGLIATALDIRYGGSLTVYHERFDETGLNNDATYQARGYTTTDFYDDRLTLAAMNYDARRLARRFGLHARVLHRTNVRPAALAATEAEARAEAAKNAAPALHTPL